MKGKFFLKVLCCGLVRINMLNISVMLPDIDFGWPVETLWLDSYGL